jgi:hypothetical protein
LKLEDAVPHLPSRVRSHLWILSAIQELDGTRYSLPSQDEVTRALLTLAPDLNCDSMSGGFLNGSARPASIAGLTPGRRPVLANAERA